MIKMLVLDMAGTSVDEDNVVYKTLQQIINEHGYNFTLQEVLTYGAGKEKLHAIKDIIATKNINLQVEMAANIYEKFSVALIHAYNIIDIKPQPGAEELFAALKEKNILVVLNTGYNNATANTILQKLHWQVGKQIDALITATDVQNSRPSADMILLAMKNFGIEHANQVVKIGDSIIDIEEGQNASCGLCVGITTGAHTYEQLLSAKPDHIINHLSELLPLL